MSNLTEREIADYGSEEVAAAKATAAERDRLLSALRPTKPAPSRVHE